MSSGPADLRTRVAAATARFGPTDPRTLRLRQQLADGLLVHGRHDEAFGELDALVTDCEAAFGSHHETTLVVANNRAMKLAEQSRPGGVEQLAALVPIAIAAWGPLDRRTVLLRSNLAAATGMTGRFAEAIAQLEALLEQRQALDADVIDTLETNLASWRESNGS